MKQLSIYIVFCGLCLICLESYSDDHHLSNVGSNVQYIISRQYGEQRLSESSVFRNIKDINWDALYSDIKLTNITINYITDDDSEVSVSLVYNGEVESHKEQVRLFILQNNYSIEKAKIKLYEKMGSGISIMLNDLTFRKISPGIGDECYTLNVNKTSNEDDDARHKLWFRRDNIVIEISCSGERNLMPMAIELDKVILAR